MVWNDYFDFAEDKRDRPFRPLPSGRVSLRTAVLIGTALLCIGWSCAAVTGRAGALVGLSLVVAILLTTLASSGTAAGADRDGVLPVPERAARAVAGGPGGDAARHATSPGR